MTLANYFLKVDPVQNTENVHGGQVGAGCGSLTSGVLLVSFWDQFSPLRSFKITSSRNLMKYDFALQPTLRAKY